MEIRIIEVLLYRISLNYSQSCINAGSHLVAGV